MSVLELRNIKKTYITRKLKTEVLRGIDFSVKEGEFISIMGESGSGKTTLLNIIAQLDKASLGEMQIDGRNVLQLSDKDIAKFRREKLGFVFQDFNLLDQFNNKDNIVLPLVLSNCDMNTINSRLSYIKSKLDISAIINKYPYEISGGQKQKIAIARAIITKPRLLLADEPTGSLDSASADMILKLFGDINKAGQTILMVTHSTKAASYSHRVLFIKDGIIYHEIYRGENESRQDYMERISQAQLLVGRKEE